ncbi:MAG: MBL fold metallo-hydrolase [Candidatus Pacebacteria bacterium]|nr:MBL fold metallo-hydrolase [Candidatus Paceibacterota bacterium]
MNRRHILFTLVGTLVFVNLVFLLLLVPRTHELRVSFLTVGQGDAILLQGPTGIDVLVDGGRDRSVLRELPRVMGVLDRSIDVVVATHPDADHISGLADVFGRYRVHYFLEPGVENDTSAALRLADAVAKEPGIEAVLARRGQRLLLGGGAYADILYPSGDVSKLETNTGSIIMRVVYGETEFMLTGDAPLSIENWLVAQKENLQSDVLKAGHHGSRTSTSDEFLDAVAPALVVISAGKDNSYGHPHPEVLARVAKAGARTLSTIESGTITLVSDGVTIKQK